LRVVFCCVCDRQADCHRVLQCELRFGVC
jgi:hypothetical protein